MSSILLIIAYLFIAAQFAIAFFFNRDRRSRGALLALTAIFSLCGATRGLMHLGFNGVLLDAIHWVLTVCAFTFVLLNKPKHIVESLQVDDYKQTNK